MKLTKKEKNQFIKDVNQALEDKLEDSGILITEQGMVGCGTSTEILSMLCTCIQSIISDGIVPKDVVKEAVKFAIALSSNDDNDDEEKVDLKKMFEKLMED